MKAKLPVWLDTGVEPPESLKTTGWQEKMKPAPQYFNWFFNRTYLALKELQENGNTSELEQLINALQLVVDNHLGDPMPHRFVDNGITYRWGFRTLDGKPQFIYEEVTE